MGGGWAMGWAGPFGRRRPARPLGPAWGGGVVVFVLFLFLFHLFLFVYFPFCFIQFKIFMYSVKVCFLHLKYLNIFGTTRTFYF